VSVVAVGGFWRDRRWGCVGPAAVLVWHRLVFLMAFCLRVLEAPG